MSFLKKSELTMALLMFAVGCAAVTVPELVPVGDPGNTGQTIPFRDLKRVYPRGPVAYPFRIGKTEVTNAEYAEFLNAAAKTDPHGLFNEKMKITRSGKAGDWHYVPVSGSEKEPVTFISKIAAARYCNYLTTGDTERGTYVIAPKIRENGETHEALVGFRDLTGPDSPVVYYLPDMHEFFKAGWYDGRNSYKTVTQDNRNEPSHYGMLNYASGVREWVENKYYGNLPFAFGAASGDNDAEVLSTETIYTLPEYLGKEKTGFRVAATAGLQIGKALNSHRNFFYEDENYGMLRIRSDAAVKEKIKLELRDFAMRQVWTQTIEPDLKPGVTAIKLDIPQNDGYYELVVTPFNPSYQGRSITIPLAVIRDKMPAMGGNGNFGTTCHITRQERRFTFMEVDFDLLRRLGVSVIRVNVKLQDTDGSRSVLKRIKAAGLRPLAIITVPEIKKYEIMAGLQQKHPDLIRKWRRHNVSAELAWYAEQVYQLVSAEKDVAKDWEIGNEPTYWKITAEDYSQILKTAYTAAKLADPSCNVMAADLMGLHAPVLNMRIGDFCNSIAFHTYGFYVPTFWGVAGKMREFNGWKQAAGIADKPVWLTEIGGCTYNSGHMIPVRTLDESLRYQALHQPKIMAGGLAFGACKVLPYNYHDVPCDYFEEEFGMIDREGYPKPSALSRRITAKLLGLAHFTGFLKGHSFEVGKIVGLAFKDPEKRDVVVFWRNDPYGPGDYSRNFQQIIGKPETVKLPCTADSFELFNLSGGKTVLKTTNATAAILVNEYPVFVRGHFKLEFADVSLQHPKAKIQFPAAVVKIRPDPIGKACDMMAGTVMELTEGRRGTVTVSVYNLTDRPINGTLRLVPRSSWVEWPWRVTPEQVKLEILPNSSATGKFALPILRPNKDKLIYLDAFFTTDSGQMFENTIVGRVIPSTYKAADWTVYQEGFNIASTDDSTALKITWRPDHASYVLAALRRPREIAATAAVLPSAMKVSFFPDGAGIHAVNLLFMDKSGEIYQLRQTFTAKDKTWQTADFNPQAILSKGVIIHNRGDKNKVIDFPVRFLGCTFELKSPAASGSITVRPPEPEGR